MSSIKVLLTAITAFHMAVEGFLMFSPPAPMTFLKDLRNLFLQLRAPMPLWDHSLELNQLIKQPFQPYAMCLLLHLCMKMAFLVAIAYAPRIGEMKALVAGPPYTVFSKEKVSL